jgi:hypothetical protein
MELPRYVIQSIAKDLHDLEQCHCQEILCAKNALDDVPGEFFYTKVRQLNNPFAALSHLCDNFALHLLLEELWKTINKKH